MIRLHILMLWLIALLCLFGAVVVLLAGTSPSGNRPESLAGAQFAALTGGAIRYQSAGRGPRTVLFLHGFNQHLGIWDDAWARLGNCPVRLIRIDLPGFGESHFDSNDFGLAAQSERLIELLDALHIDRVTVVGSSMGGSLAVWLAAQYPQRVEQLGLLAPSGYPGSLQYGGVFGRLLQPGRVKTMATWLAGTRPYKGLFPRSMLLQALTVTADYGEAWLEQLKKVQAPTLVAWSPGDRTAHAQAAESVAANLADGTLYWLDEQAGHVLPITRPDFTAQAACLLGQGVAPREIAAGE